MTAKFYELIALVTAMSGAAAIHYATAAFADSPLQGGISHAETIEPQFRALKPGDSFSESGFHLSKPGQWVQIPRWLAGNWIGLEELQTFKQTLSTGEVDNASQIIRRQWNETFGLQDDSKKNIWTLTESPLPIIGLESSIENGADSAPLKVQRKTYTLVKNTFHDESDGRIVLNSLTTEVSVDSASGKIVRLDNHKLVRQITRLSEDILACTVDDKTFDQDGIQTSRARYAILLRRSSDFVPKNQTGRQSLRSSFEKFLEKQGSLDLKKVD